MERICYSDIKENIKNTDSQGGKIMESMENMAVKHIFGSYIMDIKWVPGVNMDDSAKSKAREKELFEVVDDYIEQA